MKVRIYHLTEYVFSGAVFLEPHMLKFKPRQDPGQRLIFFELKIKPETMGSYECLDESGNLSELVWFDDLHQKLIIETRSDVELFDKNSFGFLIYPFSNNQMPIKYGLSNGLDKYLQYSIDQKDTHDYVKQLMKNHDGNSINFLLSVTQQLHDGIKKTVRHSGHPHLPDFTLKQKKGSCRDIAVLEMEILRKAGFATRFVSGYKFNEDPEENHELHAWIEVFIPGPGWMGFDPSTGFMVSNDHIPISSSFLPENTLPVSGTFRGSAEAKMKTKIQINKYE